MRYAKTDAKRKKRGKKIEVGGGASIIKGCYKGQCAIVERVVNHSWTAVRIIVSDLGGTISVVRVLHNSYLQPAQQMGVNNE